MSDQRRFQRIQFSAPVELRKEDHVWHTQMLDLSLLGALALRTEKMQLSKNESIELLIGLDGLTQPLVIPAIVRHLTDDQVGFQFNKLPIECLSQIRRVLEVNLADETLMQRDLQALIFTDKSDS